MYCVRIVEEAVPLKNLRKIFSVGAVTVMGTAGFVWLSFKVPTPVSSTDINFTLTEVIIVQPGGSRVENGSLSVKKRAY